MTESVTKRDRSKGAEMTKWEYEIMVLDTADGMTVEEAEKFLNCQGAKRWELVSQEYRPSGKASFFFKRPICNISLMTIKKNP